MIDRRTYLEHYWNPYMLSEREFLEIAGCVALRKSNYHTCGIIKIFAHFPTAP